MNDRIQFVCTAGEYSRTYNQLYTQLVVQTCPDWMVHFECPIQSAQRDQYLRRLHETDGRWIIFTMDAQYRNPNFVKYMLKSVRDRMDIGIVTHCSVPADTHEAIFNAYPRWDDVVPGYFMVRLDYLNRAPLNDIDVFAEPQWLERIYSRMHAEHVHLMNVHSIPKNVLQTS